MFVLIAVALCLLSAVFVLLPLMSRKSDPQDAARDELNRQVFEDRLKEIAALELSDSERAQLELDAKRDLLGDVEGETTTAKVSSSGRSVILAALVLVPLVSGALYQQRGALEDYRLAMAFAETSPEDRLAYRGLVGDLADRVRETPDNYDARFLLARAYGHLGEFEDAASIYNGLMADFPDDASLASYYAEAMFVADDRQLTARVQDAIDQTLAINPNDLTVIELSAIGAINKGDPALALKWFQRALATGVQGERAALIRRAMTQVSAASGLSTAEGGRAVTVTLNVSDSISLPETSPVFVYARASSGPPAPLAIQRYTLGGLPSTVRLDQSMSMVQGFSLAEFDEIQIVARVSSTGEVRPTSGDYEATSGVLTFEEDELAVELTIEKQIP